MRKNQIHEHEQKLTFLWDARTMSVCKARCATPIDLMQWWILPGPRRAWAIANPFPKKKYCLFKTTSYCKSILSHLLPKEWTTWHQQWRSRKQFPCGHAENRQHQRQHKHGQSREKGNKFQTFHPRKTIKVPTKHTQTHISHLPWFREHSLERATLSAADDRATTEIPQPFQEQ